MNPSAEERLMRYLDGDLDGEEAAAVERWMAESTEAQRLCSDLERVRVELRAISEERGRRADSIVEGVMARIDAAGGAKMRVVRGGGGQGPDRRVLAFVPALGLALAAAAAVVAYFRPHPAPIAALRERPTAAVSQAPAAEAFSGASAAAVSSEPAAGASIESVDFGGQNGTIFMVAAGQEVTPVVWLDDGEPSSG